MNNGHSPHEPANPNCPIKCISLAQCTGACDFIDSAPVTLNEPTLTDAQINKGLRLHHFNVSGPSHLANAFIEGCKYGATLTATPTQAPAASQPTLVSKGLSALKHLVATLQETGLYSDEDGEATQALNVLHHQLASREPVSEPVEQPAAYIGEWGGLYTPEQAAATKVNTEPLYRGKPGWDADMLLNLLACIHGDGGHYVAEHGLDKAAADAESKVATWAAGGDARFEKHTTAVAEFLNELYAIMVDPCATGTTTVKEMQAALLAAALRQREAVGGDAVRETLSEARSFIAELMGEITNLCDKLGRNEPAGWEGSRRRGVHQPARMEKLNATIDAALRTGGFVGGDAAMEAPAICSAWASRAFDPDEGHYGNWGAWKITNYKPPRQPDKWFHVVALPFGIRSPLSGEQIAQLIPSHQDGWTIEQYCEWMARAIERAHGIGGSGGHGGGG